MHVSEVELKEFILDSGLVSKKEIEIASDEATKREKSLGDILVSRGSLTEDALRHTHAYVLGIPFVNLKDRRIGYDVLSLITEPVARTHSIVAFKRGDGELEVAMLDIEDLASVEVSSRKMGLKVLPRLTDSESIKHALLQYQKYLRDEFGNVIHTESGMVRLLNKNNKDLSNSDLKNMSESLPIVHIVDALLRHAIIQNASDIHIEPQEGSLLVRYRIDGILHDAMTLPKSAEEGIIARIKTLAGLKIEEKNLPQDGRFKMETEKDQISFRVGTLPTFFGQKIVMRVLHETGEGFTLETLGLHGVNVERVHEALREKSGLIVVSGISDSGKTTTLYTLLDILNRPHVHISTIEDPIEYQMKRVSQMQVDKSIGLTFVSGLRALMRQDSDIIMIGEIKDGETASLAVNAALSGKLVLASVTAKSGAEAISSLLHFGVEPFMLASTLKIVVGQRLVRKLCDNKKAVALTAPERLKLAPVLDFENTLKTLKDEKLVKKDSTLDDLTFYKPVAGDECVDGYKGRVGIFETIRVSPTLRELMLRSSTSEALEAQAKKEGTLTMREDGIYKAACGMTSLEEAVKTSSD